MPDLKRKKVELVAATLIVFAVLGATLTVSPAFVLILFATCGLWTIMVSEAIGRKGWWRRSLG